MFELGEISAKRFLAEYWRKKPLFLKGGARLLLEQEVSVAEFRMICDRLERSRPGRVVRRTGCIFAERIDEVSPELRRVAQQHELRSSCRRAWFDGAYATSEVGLGSHYDRRDCFVLSQLGSERWRLCSPEVLSPKELAVRMLERSSGPVHMPDDCHEYVLEAGDLLYVPLFWGHWPIAEGGPALSLSLMLEANNAIDVLLPALAQVLAEDRAWWYPLPEVLAEEVSGSRPPPAINECFDVLLESLARPDFAKRARAVWWHQGYAKTQEVPEKRPRSTSVRRLRPEDAGLDSQRVARLVEAEIPPPDAETAAAPGDRAAARLKLLLGRRVLRDLFDLALKSRATFPKSPGSASILHLAWAIQHADLEAIAPLVARPEVTSWLWRMSEALQFGQASYFEEIASPLTRLFFPALLTVQSHLRGSTLPIGRSHERGINLLSARRRITSPVPLGTRMNVSLLGPILRFSSAAGVLVEFPADSLMERGIVDIGTGFYVEDLPATKHAEIVVLERDAWMFGQYPRGNRFGARPLSQGPIDGLPLMVDRHAHAIEAVWPELAKELSTLISVALPLSGRDAKVQTAPPFLGAVALTEQAQPADLVEELGRTKARLVWSLGLAFERPVRPDVRERFEAAVAGAYRRAFEELAGLEISGEATPFTQRLSPWGHAFMDAVFALMK